MSGATGVTCGDISLAKDQEQEQNVEKDKTLEKKSHNKTNTEPKKAASLSFSHLNSLVIIIILAAGGLVSPQDFAFVIFSIIYMYFLSVVAFPSLNPPNNSPVFDLKGKTLRIYVSVGAIVGLYLPIVYILEGTIEGDKEGIKAAAPHLFLLASQVVMEGITFSARFAIPIRVFVPVLYNSKRIFTIAAWLMSEFSKVEGDYNRGSVRRLLMGRALALANLAFWCFNLFGFLLPVYLPRAFKMYYSSSKVKD